MIIYSRCAGSVHVTRVEVFAPSKYPRRYLQILNTLFSSPPYKIRSHSSHYLVIITHVIRDLLLVSIRTEGRNYIDFVHNKKKSKRSPPKSMMQRNTPLSCATIQFSSTLVTTPITCCSTRGNPYLLRFTSRATESSQQPQSAHQA